MRVMNLRFRIDPLLAGESDPAKRAEIWDRETRQICEEIARAAAAPFDIERDETVEAVLEDARQVRDGLAADRALAMADESWKSGWTPDPRISVSEWADAHRMLPQRAASEPGPWRTSRTPFAREIMDCLSDHHPAQEVVLMASVQMVKSEAGLNWAATRSTTRRARCWWCCRPWRSASAGRSSAWRR
jgi:hypothetical protein